METHRAVPQPPPLPPDLPAPVDDGAAAHLVGRPVPGLELRSTAGEKVNLRAMAREGLVLYAFPKMGAPHIPDPPGWDATPGAYGCTQESCGFRDRAQVFTDLGYLVAGISAQQLEEQKETSQRLHLSFPLLADPSRDLGEALSLPMFSIGGMTLYKRLTLVAREGRILKVFYPVFPPDEHPDDVLRWVQSHTGGPERDLHP